MLQPPLTPAQTLVVFVDDGHHIGAAIARRRQKLFIEAGSDSLSLALGTWASSRDVMDLPVDAQDDAPGDAPQDDQGDAVARDVTEAARKDAEVAEDYAGLLASRN